MGKDKMQMDEDPHSGVRVQLGKGCHHVVIQSLTGWI